MKNFRNFMVVLCLETDYPSGSLSKSSSNDKFDIINKEQAIDDIHSKLVEIKEDLKSATTEREKIQKSIAEIIVTLEVVVENINRLSSETPRGSLQLKSPVDNLPLKSTDELQSFENKLKNSLEFKSNMLNYMKSFGGRDGCKFARAIYKFLFADDLLILYSWAGKGEKSNFSQFEHINSLIVLTVRNEDPTFTLDINKRSLQEYLKQTKARINSRLLK